MAAVVLKWVQVCPSFPRRAGTNPLLPRGPDSLAGNRKRQKIGDCQGEVVEAPGHPPGLPGPHGLQGVRCQAVKTPEDVGSHVPGMGASSPQPCEAVAPPAPGSLVMGPQPGASFITSGALGQGYAVQLLPEPDMSVFGMVCYAALVS